MDLLNNLKSRLSGYALAVGAAVLLGAFGGLALQQYFNGGCCAVGAACCQPGAPCCAGHQHAHK
jgi:hypothetical protein